MSHGTDKRHRLICINAYKLHIQGFTHRQIAAQLGLKPEQVSTRVSAGERLSDSDSGEASVGEQEKRCE